MSVRNTMHITRNKRFIRGWQNDKDDFSMMPKYIHHEPQEYRNKFRE